MQSYASHLGAERRFLLMLATGRKVSVASFADRVAMGPVMTEMVGSGRAAQVSRACARDLGPYGGTRPADTVPS